eukprot:8422070-Lingulodinium_polyedra.AAC.1
MPTDVEAAQSLAARRHCPLFPPHFNCPQRLGVAVQALKLCVVVLRLPSQCNVGDMCTVRSEPKRPH